MSFDTDDDFLSQIQLDGNVLGSPSLNDLAMEHDRLTKKIERRKRYELEKNKKDFLRQAEEDRLRQAAKADYEKKK